MMAAQQSTRRHCRCGFELHNTLAGWRDCIEKNAIMDVYFAELGRSVLTRWKAKNFSPDAFSEIAVQALDERPPAEHVEVSSLIRQFLLDDEQPFQTQSGFGQPELVVYDDPRFYIQILFWLEGTTDIHQHMFSGAFHVLAGSSIHSRFALDNPQSVTAHLRLGNLRVTDTQLLETGSTVPIVSGNGFVHSLFHLETPSLTVVIRTHTDPGTGPQFTYLPPHIAVDPFHHDALTMRRKQLLDVMEKTHDERYAEIVLEMLGNLDFERGFFILQNGIGHLRNLGRWEDAVACFQQRHGALAEFVVPTLNEIVRRDGLVEFRCSLTDLEHRFFLALLLNVPARSDILDFVAKRFPCSPVETTLRWAEELTSTSESGTWILDAEFPEGLGVPLEDQAEVAQAALRYFIEGGKAPKKFGAHKLAREEIEELRAAFAGSSWRALVT